jgi:hypothetical protein
MASSAYAPGTPGKPVLFAARSYLETYPYSTGTVLPTFSLMV